MNAVHDRQTGTTTRVSVDSAGAQTNSSSWLPAISAADRSVAFRGGLVDSDSLKVFVEEHQQSRVPSLPEV